MIVIAEGVDSLTRALTQEKGGHLAVVLDMRDRCLWQALPLKHTTRKGTLHTRTVIISPSIVKVTVMELG
jgi:hypothetical protein